MTPATQRRSPAEASLSGAEASLTGAVAVDRVAGRSRVTRCYCRSPLKILTPHVQGDVACVVTSTLGGGLVQGDHVALRLDCGEQTRTVLTTQSSNKVYRSPRSLSGQSLGTRVADGAALAILPDATTCFADADFDQSQHVELSRDASLLLLDSYTSGRRASGERWAFRRFLNQIEVAVGGRTVVRDRVLLDPADGPLSSSARMGRFDAVATLILLGPQFAKAAEAIVREQSKRPLTPGAAQVVVASAVEGGAVIRGAGIETESLWLTMRSMILSAAPWAEAWLGRKW